MIENDKELDALLVERQSKNEMTIDFNNANKDANNVSKDLIQKGVDAAIMHKVSNDENVKKQFLNTADKVVNANLNTIENEADIVEKASILKNNKDACDLYGIDEKTVPKWVVYCAKRVQDVWYAVWLVVGFFTTVPIVFLGKKINVVLKHTWLSMLLAILIYILCMTSSLWFKYLKF